MIFIEKLYKKKLTTIIKNYKSFELIFDENGKRIEIYFDGFLFESEFSSIGEKVLNVKFSSNIGINGLDTLRYYQYNPSEYRQIIIEFEKTNHRETDLICVYKKYEIK